MIIFCAKPSDSFEIWMWIYICHVSDVQRPNFLIVESLCPIIFSAIDPPAWSEFAPIISGSILLSCSLRVFTVVLTALTMSTLVTFVQYLLLQTSHIRFSSVPLLIRMWYTVLWLTWPPFCPLIRGVRFYPFFCFSDLIFWCC